MRNIIITFILLFHSHSVHWWLSLWLEFDSKYLFCYLLITLRSFLFVWIFFQTPFPLFLPSLRIYMCVLFAHSSEVSTMKCSCRDICCLKVNIQKSWHFKINIMRDYRLVYKYQCDFSCFHKYCISDHNKRIHYSISMKCPCIDSRYFCCCCSVNRVVKQVLSSLHFKLSFRIVKENNTMVPVFTLSHFTDDITEGPISSILQIL